MLYISTQQELKTFNGIIFGKEKDKLFKYNLYVPELKITSTIKTETDYDNFTEINVKLFVFQDEKRLKKKIRFQIVS